MCIKTTIKSSSEARLLLSFHSGRNPDVNNPKWTGGFLGALRPFKKTLPEENFHEIINCLKALKDDFEAEQISRDVIADLWGICHLGRAWALHKDGMLQSNNLITQEQIQTIEDWINIISHTVNNLLDGQGDEAFWEYEEYVQRGGA
ncbi:MAG: hypothetical protein FWG66_16280 [Spirochaetes bacterium]|nr:hypothetical protein [Spirochaetota bacterium]